MGTNPGQLTEDRDVPRKLPVEATPRQEVEVPACSLPRPLGHSRLLVCRPRLPMDCRSPSHCVGQAV